jgi:hypothetical protein
MKKLKGCGKFEIDFFVPFDGRAREKKWGARRKHICGEHSDAGIFLCHFCAAVQGVAW